MDKYIGAVQFMLAFIVSWYAVYKTITELAEQKTKRAEVEAKENSLGREAVVLLKAEIAELQKARSDSTTKFEKIESVIRQLENMIEFIEKRMLSNFPSK